MKSKNLNWKSVKIEGTIDGNDLQGFAGLEVLENYDNTLLSNNKGRKRSFAISELDGEILSTSLNKKTKNSDEDNKYVNERAKKKGTTNNYPGKYVLLKTPEQRIENDPFRAAWNKVGIFSEEIIRALVELNFSTPTEIQKLAIPDAAIKRCDILGAAETGSGKTLAFGLPVVQSIHQELQDDPKKMEDLFCLVLTPTRELASQINDHLKEIAKYTDVSIACIIGGLAQVKQERVLNSNPHIVIGTPGRIWEFIESGNQHLQKILHIKHLVIDETDRMIEKGHFAELEKILDAVNNNNRESFKRQIFVFSATLTMLHELPEYVVRRKKKFIAPTEMTKEQKLDTFISLFGMTKPKVVDITSTSAVAKKLIESRILCAIDEKDFYLYYILLNHPGRTIIFCNSIDCVKRNVSVLSHLNITPIFLHGKMEQKQRLRNLEK